MKNNMKIEQVQREIENSLANLKASALPPALQGLRHLPLGSYEPRVSIRYWSGKQYRKVRKDADASYFEPESCDVVIEFVPSADPHDEFARHRADSLDYVLSDAGAYDHTTAMDELLEALSEVERSRDFVGLKWFRDRYLRTRGFHWASEPRSSGSLLRRATEQRLILTSQVPNPNNPLHPVTAIRINRRHPRFQTETQRRGNAFTPISIRGGAIADTVLGDRR